MHKALGVLRGLMKFCWLLLHREDYLDLELKTEIRNNDLTLT